MSNSTPNDFNQQVIADFRANGGDVSAASFGKTLILVHHTGAKSNVERVTPLATVRHDDDTWLVAASKAGGPTNPDWYYNLLAHPHTTIETPDEGVVEVQASELTGAERDAGWERFKELSPSFSGYETSTTRTIPIIALRRH